MSLQELPMAFVLLGLVFYVVLGGADFGAAMWQFAVRRGDRAGLRPGADGATLL